MPARGRPKHGPDGTERGRMHDIPSPVAVKRADRAVIHTSLAACANAY